MLYCGNGRSVFDGEQRMNPRFATWGRVYRAFPEAVKILPNPDDRTVVFDPATVILKDDPHRYRLIYADGHGVVYDEDAVRLETSE